MKVLEIRQRGYVWHIPAEAIAKNRAKYYSESYKSDTTYQDEFEYTMGDDFEIGDWYFNNMDWEDIAQVAKLVKYPELAGVPDPESDMDHEVKMVKAE